MNEIDAKPYLHIWGTYLDAYIATRSSFSRVEIDIRALSVIDL